MTSPFYSFIPLYSCACLYLNHLDPSLSPPSVCPLTSRNKSCTISKHSSLLFHNVGKQLLLVHGDISWPMGLRLSWGGPGGRQSRFPYLGYWGSPLLLWSCALLNSWKWAFSGLMSPVMALEVDGAVCCLHSPAHFFVCVEIVFIFHNQPIATSH